MSSFETDNIKFKYCNCVRYDEDDHVENDYYHTIDDMRKAVDKNFDYHRFSATFMDNSIEKEAFGILAFKGDTRFRQFVPFEYSQQKQTGGRKL